MKVVQLIHGKITPGALGSVPLLGVRRGCADCYRHVR